MANLSQRFEKMAHDITSGPGLVDTLEIAALGGIVGAALGYAKDRDASGAKSFALWGAGFGIAGQFLLFHMLKPALKTFGHTAHAAAQLPQTHTGLRQPASSHYTGAVKGIGGFRGGQMPFGPGPWPTGGAAAPDGNHETPNPARLDPTQMHAGDPYFGGQVDELHYDNGLDEYGGENAAFMGDSTQHNLWSGPEATGWGFGEMAAPYGRGYYERGEIQPGQVKHAWWE
jgi:hypothetical protein